MRKQVAYFLILAVLMTCFTGCGKQKNTTAGSGTIPEGKTENTVIKDDNKIDTKEVELTVKLYFPDKNAMNIVKEERKIRITGAKGSKPDKPVIEDVAAACMEELVKGPRSNELSNSIPKATKVRNIAIEKGILSLDLSEEFVNDHPGGSTGTIMTLSQIVLTLTELEGVEQVAFKVNGQILNDFKGHVDLGKPFKRSDFEQNLYR